jgi:hypothetical protein
MYQFIFSGRLIQIVNTKINCNKKSKIELLKDKYLQRTTAGFLTEGVSAFK